MKVMFHPPTGEVDLVADRAELSRLAAAVAAGAGTMPAQDAVSPYGETVLLRVDVRTAPGRIMITADAATRTLTITGAPEHLETLAGLLADMSRTARGGHVHIEHYPDHPYLQEGSAPLVLNGPLGGMPR